MNIAMRKSGFFYGIVALASSTALFPGARADDISDAKHSLSNMEHTLSNLERAYHDAEASLNPAARDIVSNIVGQTSYAVNVAGDYVNGAEDAQAAAQQANNLLADDG